MKTPLIAVLCILLSQQLKWHEYNGAQPGSPLVGSGMGIQESEEETTAWVS